VDLAAVMRLVVDDMAEDLDQRPTLVLPGRVAVGELAGQRRLVETADDGDQPLVLGPAGGAQLGEIAIEFLVEALDAMGLAVETRQPNPVADQDVVQREVDRAEEGGPLRLALGVGELGASRVEPVVGPGVVGGQTAKIGGIQQLLLSIGLTAGSWPPERLRGFLLDVGQADADVVQHMIVEAQQMQAVTVPALPSGERVKGGAHAGIDCANET
jgi:hypothetical protein